MARPDTGTNCAKNKIRMPESPTNGRKFAPNLRLKNTKLLAVERGVGNQNNKIYSLRRRFGDTTVEEDESW